MSQSSQGTSGQREQLDRVLSRAAPAVAAGDVAWGGQLSALMEAVAGIPPSAGGSASPIAEVLHPFLTVANARLDQEMSRDGMPVVLPSARQELVQLLLRRLTRLCLPVLALERRALDISARSFGVTLPLESNAKAWWNRFEQYPALAYLMTLTFRCWRENALEALTRLEADRPLLSERLLGGRPLPALAGVRGDAGDVHDGGRSVMVLRFQDGGHVVYKPKDLRITWGVMDLLTWLNEAGLSPPLPVRTVLPRGDYSWEEFVPAAPCQTRGEVERYYRRMGMQVRLFQLLEARDLWLDNLIAHGEYPSFIDLEMVLQPRRAGPEEERPTSELLEESVAPIGILASPFRAAPGVPAEDLGALAPPRVLITPEPSIPAYEALEGGQRPARNGHVAWAAVAHAPTLDGEPVRAADYFPELLSGYQEMHAFLSAKRNELLAPSGPLERLAGLPVRYIYRDTWSCYRLIRAGLEPALLADPSRRRAIYEDMLELAGGSDADRLVIQEELASILTLDVPYFLSRTDGSALLASSGRVLREDFFEGNAMERARRRLREIESFPLALHLDLLRSTFSTGEPPRPPPPVVARTYASDDSEVDWSAAAIALGESLLEYALPTGDGQSWIGLQHDPQGDSDWPQRLSPELLSGSTGIALLLAELHAMTRQVRFRTAALQALAATRDAVKRAPSKLMDVVGAFIGIGSSLYALHRCAITLEAPELEEEVQACIAGLPVEQFCSRATTDLVVGGSGLVLALISCGAQEPARRGFEVLARRFAASEGSPPPFPATARVLRALPSTRSAFALCAARLERRAAVPEFSLSTQPTPGDLLAYLELCEATPEAHTALRAQVLRFLHAPARDSATRLEQWELALTARLVLDDTDARRQAERLGREFLLERSQTGRWFADRWAAERHLLSALWGLPALARAFLRLADPRVPSLRLVH